ncbi:MAG: hotdog fold thioesterase [Chitinophagaceae bacterium]|nr:hotdog fold thioesterase [Chitinophagaceae bacterium]
MAIWGNNDLTVEGLKQLLPNTMGETLGIEFVAFGDDFISARMPVDNRTRQPYGLLHGGASCALAETVGSVASALVVDHEKFACVGLEINANHVRSAREGFVTATAKPLHLGANTHVWDIRITDEANRLICVSRLTVAVIPRKESFRRPGL